MNTELWHWKDYAMKQKSTAIFVVLVALMLTSPILAQPSGRPRPPRPDEAVAPRRQGAEQRQLAQRIRDQIAELKGNQEILMAQLKAIHELALKEKATETADKVAQLIRTRQEVYQTRMEQLQAQQQRVQRALRGRMRRPERPERQGRRAPEFELDSFDGQTASLSQYKGRVVVLEWFNMGCPFSKYHYETKPTMVNLAKKYKDKEVVWLAINSTNNTTPEANVAFAKKHKLPYPILDDRAGRVGRAYSARTTPHIIIVDKEGVVAYNGAIDSAPMGKVKEGVQSISYVDQALAQLTSGQKVKTPATPPYGCSVKYGRR